MNKKKKARGQMTTGILLVAAVLLLMGSVVGSSQAALTYFSETYKARILIYDIGVTLVENERDISWRDYTGADDKWDENTGVLLEYMLETEEQKAAREAAEAKGQKVDTPDLILGKKKKVRPAIHGSHNGKAKREYSCTNGWLACEMSFGDYRTAVATPILRGGSIECNFGNYTVDFSGCEALAENCKVEVENNFGSLTLLVPDHFRVELGSNETFAGDVEVKGSPAPETQGLLIINGESNFGSLEIKYI